MKLLKILYETTRAYFINCLHFFDLNSMCVTMILPVSVVKTFHILLGVWLCVPLHSVLFHMNSFCVRSDVAGQVLPLLGMDWTQNGVVSSVERHIYVAVSQ